MNESVPVLRHTSWRHLLRDIEGTTMGRRLMGMTLAQKHTTLAAAVAVARAIAVFAPELLKRPSIRVLVPGTEFFDRVDEGKWYSMVGWLLGNPAMQVTVVNVGPHIGVSNGEPAPHRMIELPESEGFRPTAEIKEWLGRHLEIDNEGYDMAVIFHPGFAEHTEWFLDAGLRHLVDSDAVVVATAEKPADIRDELWLAGLFGLGCVEGDQQHNPFELELSRSTDGKQFIEQTKWAGEFWRVSRTDTEESPFAIEFIKAATHLRVEVKTAMSAGFEAQKQFLMTMREAGSHVAREVSPQLEGVQAQQPLITLPRSMVVLTESGQVFDLEKNALIDGVLLPPEVIAAYPDVALKKVYTYPGVLWAVWVYTKYVLPKLEPAETA